MPETASDPAAVSVPVPVHPLTRLDTSGDHVFVPVRVPFARLRWVRLHRHRAQVTWWTVLLLVVGLSLVPGDLVWLGVVLLLLGLAGLALRSATWLVLRPYLETPRVRMVLGPEQVVVADGDPPGASRSLRWDEVGAVTTGIVEDAGERRALLLFEDHDPREAEGPATTLLAVTLDLAHGPDLHRLLPWVHRLHPGVALLALTGAERADWLGLRPRWFGLPDAGQSSSPSPE